jgi:hypothetical protein
MIKTKSLLALLALGVAVVLSGCSVADPNAYDPNNPLTWLTYGDVVSATAEQGNGRILTVNMTNHHSEILTTDTLENECPTVTLTVNAISVTVTTLAVVQAGGIPANGGTGTVTITYTDADLSTAIAAIAVGETTISTNVVDKDSEAATALNKATTITQVLRAP